MAKIKNYGNLRDVEMTAAEFMGLAKKIASENPPDAKVSIQYVDGENSIDGEEYDDGDVLVLVLETLSEGEDD